MIKQLISSTQQFAVKNLADGPIRNTLKALYWALPAALRRSKLVSETIRTLSSRKSSTFIQIGANDGLHCDPISPYILDGKWQGLLIEPHPTYFKALRETYEGIKGLEFECCAISETTERRKLYISKSDQGISSFSNDHVKKHVGEQEEVEAIDVDCLPLANLLEKYGLWDITLLLIDTEGYDFQILKTINFKKFSAEVIIFEHAHFSEKEKADCTKLLNEAGYNLRHTTEDSVAIKSNSSLRITE